ncbi:hypothetical protein N4G70_36285 [Streptomyces sp. ASQP_92]|uniref:hypothetical protein n=1 Tax=Streptomyces sp. ASQP_92 TaxID=2979116 RepID=UPI0021BED062|nr:hypothetical protein [Streptomyces sp. ASQP_92]MCT9094260.1 hypothetical protein [Streptomyces sp. ASQP_92]
MTRHPEHLGIKLLAHRPEPIALNSHVRALAEILTTRSSQHLKDCITISGEAPGNSTLSRTAWRQDRHLPRGTGELDQNLPPLRSSPPIYLNAS